MCRKSCDHSSPCAQSIEILWTWRDRNEQREAISVHATHGMSKFRCFAWRMMMIGWVRNKRWNHVKWHVTADVCVCVDSRWIKESRLWMAWNGEPIAWHALAHETSAMSRAIPLILSINNGRRLQCVSFAKRNSVLFWKIPEEQCMPAISRIYRYILFNFFPARFYSSRFVAFCALAWLTIQPRIRVSAFSSHNELSHCATQHSPHFWCWALSIWLAKSFVMSKCATNLTY